MASRNFPILNKAYLQQSTNILKPHWWPVYPKMVLIVSDMEFNSCGRTRNLDVVKAKYHALGLTPPTLVFWRVDVKSAQQPATFRDDGTVLINGFSPAILKELLAGNIENLTPLSLMLKAIGDKYDYLDNLFK